MFTVLVSFIDSFPGVRSFTLRTGTVNLGVGDTDLGIFPHWHRIGLHRHLFNPCECRGTAGSVSWEASL